MSTDAEMHWVEIYPVAPVEPNKDTAVYVSEGLNSIALLTRAWRIKNNAYNPTVCAADNPLL